MTINWVYQAYTPKKHDCGHQSLMLKGCFSWRKKRDRPITYAFCGDLHISQCCLVFYKKTCLKEGEVPQKSFSDVTLVTQGLPSSFLSCPVA